MKISRKQIIFIIILSIILIGSIIAYFLTRTKDNYIISRERFSNKLSIKNLITQGKLNSNGTFKYLTKREIELDKEKSKPNISKNAYKFYKKNQMLSQKDFPKYSKNKENDVNNLKLNLGIGKPSATEEEWRRAKADKGMDDYLTGLDDANSSAAKGILTSLYDALKCDMQFDCDSGKALLNLTKEIGIGLLKIGLACAGLGFLGGGLDAIFGGGASGPPAIDYNRIKNIVTDAVQKQSILDYTLNVNIKLDNIKSFINIYTDLKNVMTQSNCDEAIYDDIIKCMKQPNYNNPNLKFDPSLIVQNTGTLNGEKNKREFLKTYLQSSPLYDMINNKELYGINGIIKYSQINVFASTQLYSTFKLLIGFYIVYYQEMAMIDQNVVDGKYINPWFSSYIGEPGKVGKKQPLTSLLGNLQDLCQKLFDYLKSTYRRYYQNLEWSDHSNNCYTGSLMCHRWSRMEDHSNVFDDKLWNLINEKWPNNIGPRWSSYMDDLDNSDTNRINTIASYKIHFDDYMNSPFQELKPIKKMAGIDYLIGERDFSWNNWMSSGKDPSGTNKETIYSLDGGYPFGSGKSSYSNVVNHINYNFQIQVKNCFNPKQIVIHYQNQHFICEEISKDTFDVTAFMLSFYADSVNSNKVTLNLPISTLNLGCNVNGTTRPPSNKEIVFNNIEFKGSSINISLISKDGGYNFFEISNNNNYDLINSGSSYCTPLISNIVDCDKPGYYKNSIDSSVFNISGDSKTYTDNMSCDIGFSAVSCVKPGFSPGTNTGLIEQNSRTAFCVNENNRTQPLKSSQCVSKTFTFEITQIPELHNTPSGLYLYITSFPFNETKFKRTYVKRIDEDTYDITNFIEILFNAANNTIYLPGDISEDIVTIKIPYSKIPPILPADKGTTRPPIRQTYIFNNIKVSGYPLIVDLKSNDGGYIFNATAKFYL